MKQHLAKIQSIDTPWRRRLLPLLLSLTLAGSGAVMAESARGDQKQFDFSSRAASVEVLLQARKRLEEQRTDKDRMTLGDDAEKLFIRAKGQYQQGNDAEAYSLLDQSYQLIKINIGYLESGHSDNTQSASEEDLAKARTEADFERMANSVKALSQAYQQLTGRAQDKEMHLSVSEATEELRMSAMGHQQAGNSDKGLRLLKQAYFMLQGSISEMHQGESYSESGGRVKLATEEKTTADGSTRIDNKQFQFKKRAETVEALVEAQQRLVDIIGETANTLISSDAARRMISKAEELLKWGRDAEAYILLEQSYLQVRDSVRQLEIGRSDNTRSAEHNPEMAKVETFKRRSSSVATLLKAHQRISRELEDQMVYQSIEGVVTTLQKEAQKLVENGQVEEADALLKKSYNMLQDSIGAMRGGQTLIRSISFASSADEYRYEMERHTTHRLLVKLLLNGPNINQDHPDFTRMMATADSQYQKANGEAGNGLYEDAVKSLEEATSTLIQVIRRSGVYIPG